MRLGGFARFLIEITSEAELTQALTFAAKENLAIHVTGEGSNTVFGDKGFNGLVIINKISEIQKSLNTETLELTLGAGERWDTIVKLSVTDGFSDIAALSAIPGTVGAAPVQNIGAYGQQISDGLVSIRAFDTKEGAFVKILQKDCNFSYRQSRFNQEDKNRFIITEVTLRLKHKTIEPPFYKDIATYLEDHSIPQKTVSPTQLREAVLHIRKRKLPDPSVVANNGSFFKNPIIPESNFLELQKIYPNLKAHKTDDGALKLYAAQLIELAGLKDYHDSATGMATWKHQALVLINESAQSTADLLVFKEKIVQAVQKNTNITLIQEPELIEK